MNIVEDDHDRWDFLKLLYYFNDTFKYTHWERDLMINNRKLFSRPEHWPEREPLVLISAFCLHDNHFHLLVKEIREGGLSEFMQRLPNSMSVRYIQRYGSKGSIFQASYQHRLIESDADLMNVALYIMIKNVFEKYPEGLAGALSQFDQAYKWALQDPFSSLADYGAERRSPIIDKDLLAYFFPTPARFKKEAREYVKWRKYREADLGVLTLEDGI